MADRGHNELRRLFDRAAEVSAEHRAALLDRECAADTELRRRAEALLAAAEDDRFLGAPTGGPVSASAVRADTTAAPMRERPGDRIGAYQLVERIGEGGFGEVWMAEQRAPVRRRVALKIIKAGMDTKEVLARFEAERQALVMMEHPNISKAYEAGATPAGRPYFVMEHVEGPSVTDYCDAVRMRIRERIALFTQVCRAVQHAHTKGIIHRDLKPSNILVTLVDGRPTPKVIDFGIAKATAAPLTDRSLHTEAGRLMGTPEYMSPEQAGSGGADVDTRSDVYSLGVILYQLLTGTLPFEPTTLRRADLSSLVKMITEVEPPRPSTRLSTLSAEPVNRRTGDTPVEIAGRRGVEFAALRRQVRGELDWIVMKCLEKDRARRYETANGLMLDVQRYLSGEPVTAAPPGRVYRLRKWVRRNRGLVSAAAAVLLVLIGGLITTLWQAAAARAARDQAQTEARIAQVVLGFLDRDLFQAIDPANAQGRSVTVREVVDSAARQIEGRFEDQPLVEAALRHTLGTAYHSIGEYDMALPHLERAVALRKQHRGLAHPETLDSMGALGRLYHDHGRYQEAEQLLEAAKAGRTRALGEEHHDTLESVHALSELFGAIPGRTREAIPLTLRAFEVSRRALGEDDETTLALQRSLARRYFEFGLSTDAERLADDVLARCTRLRGEDHPSTCAALADLGAILQNQERWDEAIVLLTRASRCCQRVYGERHVQTFEVRERLRAALRLLERHDEVAELDRLLADSIDRNLPRNHPIRLRAAASATADVHMLRGEYAQAEQVYRDEIAGTGRALSDAFTIQTRRNLAEMFVRMGRLEDARSEFETSLAIARQAGEGPRVIIVLLNGLGHCAAEVHDDASAEKVFREAIDIGTRELGPSSNLTLRPFTGLAYALMNQQKLQEAEPLLRKAVVTARARWGELHLRTAELQWRLGYLLLEMNRPDEAEPFVLSAVAGYDGLFGDEHTWAITARPLLARFLHANGDSASAAEVLREVVGALRRKDPGEQWNLNPLLDLGRVLVAQGSYAEAEAALREALAIHDRNNGRDIWRRLKTIGLLGAALAGQVRFAEAEALMLAACPSPGSGVTTRGTPQKALFEELARLYASWDAAEPGGRYAAEADRWRRAAAEIARSPPGEDAPRRPP